MQDVSDHHAGPNSHQGYRLQVTPSSQRITASLNGTTIADSADVLIMVETGHAPVHYFPRADVAMDHLVATSHRTYCPFKGDASYWSVRRGEALIDNAAWSYEAPYDEAVVIKDHIAFYWDAIDTWQADGQPMAQPARPARDQNNPLVPWLMQQAWKPTSIPELLQSFAAALSANSFPLWRARFLIQTLNPLLFARGYTWQQGEDGISEFQATHAGRNTAPYQQSPFAAILKGEGGIRRRLEGPDAQLDFPILHDLVEEGATDYVAMPMRFSDGQINILVLVSDAKGGFTTEQLGHIHEALANLSRLLEAHAARASSHTLLTTYLGKGAGNKVTNGLVQRGDSEEVAAVILMSDLRDSTRLTEQLGKADYLSALNDFFDCVAGAAVDNGGDVLKFIGDAVLAIFPIPDADDVNPAAYDNALQAVADAGQRLDVINTERAARGSAPPLAFSTGLHCDLVTFGNVGTPGRLDFTVIGSGVNKTARIAALCKELGATVLVSKAVAAHTTHKLRSLGDHELRGFDEQLELFGLAPDGNGS